MEFVEPVQVFWLSKEAEKCLKQKVKKYLDMDCEHILEKKSTHLYEETLYEICCKIFLKKPVCDCFDLLVNSWCSSEYECVTPLPYPQWWIKFDFSDCHKSLFSNIDKRVELKSFSFGTLIGLNTFVEHYSSNSSMVKNRTTFKISQSEVNFYHDIGELIIYFILANKDVPRNEQSLISHRLYRLNIKYSTIHKILMHTKSKLPLSVFLHLSSPPLIYAVKLDENSENKEYISFDRIDPLTQWIRVTDLDGNWQNIVMLPFLKIEFKNKYWTVINNLIIRSKCSRFYFSPIKFEEHKRVQNPSVPYTEFDCVYALKSITSFSSCVADQIALLKNLKDVNKELEKYAVANPKALAEALFEIRASLEKGNVIFFETALKELFKKYDMYCTKECNQSNPTETLSKNLVMIRKCILTPSRWFLISSYPSCKNRLIRTCNPDYLLRVSLRDDNLEKITYQLRQSEESQETFLQSTVISVLSKGIKIGRRHYEFVGCSVSQLREHGVWMYAKDKEGRTAADLRESVGDLSTIFNPAKYMARLGQMLSQAIAFYDVPQEWTNVSIPEEDITGGKHPDSGEPYIFSDGVGKISLSLARKIYATTKLDHEPSAIQVRYAGCKGMLVLDPKLEGDKICFRLSMRKFKSKNSSLEILKTSKPRLVFLNRPFITILEQKGIELKVFCNLQKDMLYKLTNSLVDSETAADVLSSQTEFSFNFTDESKKYIPCKRSFPSLFESGIMVANEPFFRGLLQAIFKKSVAMLKTKARIEVRKDKGRSMFGVLDETGILEYDQIFVRYSNDIEKYSLNDPKTVLTGTVLVTKNPCMHPGDVRKFTAVDVPELYHIRDCIVFPSKGMRPHPDEMAGSDLDGDEYAVIWLEDLIFKSENNKPMDYPSSASNEGSTTKEVEVKDMLNFLCSYIINDHVGRLGSAHLAWADKKSDGIFSTVCNTIAKKNALNLDFAKTGKSEKLCSNEIVISYPDFMEKLSRSDTYISRKALGVLYRECRNFDICLDAINDDVGFYSDSSLCVEGWGKYIDSAKQSLNKYRRSIHSLLALYGIDSEGELISGALSNYSKYIHEKNDSCLIIVLDSCIKEIFHGIREEFFSEFLNSDNVKSLDSVCRQEIMKKASAWYIVTYTENKNQSVACFGLPWAVSDILMEIKKNAQSIKMHQSTNITDILTENLKNSLFLEESKITEQHCRASCMNVVYIALNKWLKHHENFFLTDHKEFHALEKLLNDIITTITSVDLAYIESDKSNCNKISIHENTPSLGQNVVKCLEHIAKVYYFHNEIISASDLKFKKFGLLALITFLKLSSSPNPQYLGFSSSAKKHPELVINQKLQTEMFRLPLYNEKFNDFVVHKEELVIRKIKTLTGIENMIMRVFNEKITINKRLKNSSETNSNDENITEDGKKQNNTEQDKKEKWAVYMLVTGNKWCLEQCRNLIVQEWFSTLKF